MAAYSMDLRERVIAAYDRGDGSSRQLAKVFGVSSACIRKLLRLRRDRGSIAPIVHRRGPQRKLSEKQFDRLCFLVVEQSDLTLEEIRRRLRLPLSISRLSATLIEAGFTRKKSPSSLPNSSETTCVRSEVASPAG